MKIDAIKPWLKKSAWPLIIGGYALANISLYCTVRKINKEEAMAKTYIKTNDSIKYNELLKKDGLPRAFDWEEEAQKLETKLKMDSIAKTNYALGMQAVRDSLANTSK